ncbi:thiol:disulfide interchange protein DsbA/DsbL [Shewanella electrodiphila]|uniref:Thiol:disulfide interchange protein DsbA/DsbL n=1 Tax=Shewanella electrodiphila TaxID=934143 RepID=A0ABT0KKS3_9GAMM|nr:thiol:disulfide interchange protein DsbA/DsbL [Shewanella electrodiphila]MCL1044433.1 thiol:disulfide interchange protein DsbA/DsbL [Shewanella electrodiphila]
MIKIKPIAFTMALAAFTIALTGCGKPAEVTAEKAVEVTAEKTVETVAVLPSKFVEGQHYTKISDGPASSEPKISEFFSFYCHNCYNMETRYLPEIKGNLNKEIGFETKHVDFMNSEIGTEVMRALAVIHEVGNEKALNTAMFQAIQGEGGHHDHSAPGHSHDEPEINNRDDIKNVFAANGVDAETYDKIADSDATDAKLALWRQQQVMFQVQSVPTFIVNDKYAINMNEMATLGDLIDVMNYLALEKK